MLIYNYHPETKEYIGSSEADRSPLEEDVYLIPAYATDIKPPSVNENQKPVFNNGQWSIVADYRGTEYWLSDGSKHTITELGVELPSNAIVNEPETSQRHQVEMARRYWYQKDVDPVVNESIIKRAMGDEQEADSLLQQAIARRQEIQASLPWPSTTPEESI